MNYFAYPEMALWLLAPTAILLLGILLQRWRQKTLKSLGSGPDFKQRLESGSDPSLVVRRLLPVGLETKRRWILSLQTLGMLAMALALMGPLWGAKLVEFRQKGLDVFVAVDCSTSMLAQDFSPDRMAHAKLALGQIIDRLNGSRIGVIAFAGQAYVQCPLTVDQGAARDTLDSLDTGAVPIAGTHIGDAIRLALKGMQAGEGSNRALILLSDGEDHKSQPLEAAKEAAKMGMKIFAIGIGSKDGEPIPVLNDQGERTGYKRDKKGEVILSKLDQDTLFKIAQETGGQYYQASAAGDEVEPLLRDLEKLQTGDQKTQLFNRYENRFQWPLVIGILLLLISLAIPEMGFRSSSSRNVGADATRKASDRLTSDPSTSLIGPRQGRSGATSLGIILSLLTFTSMAFASNTQLKKGNREFKNGNYEKALKLYDDALIDRPHSPVLHFNAGAAAYQKGDFYRAETEFTESAKAAQSTLQDISHYNRGNALFRRQRYDDAIEAYKEALRINPKDENAKYNLGVARRAKQNPPQQKPDEGQGTKGQEKQPGKKDSAGAPESRGAGEKQQMSKEDAERLLSAAAAGERKKSDQKASKEQKAGDDEDW